MILTGRPPKEASPWRIVIALVLTVVFHAATVALVVLWSSLFPPSDSRNIKKNEVVLRPLTAEQFAKNRGADESRKTAQTRPDSPKKKNDEKKPEEVPKGQVVAVPQGNEKKPDNAKYLAESNNSVDKETRARQQTAFYKNAANQQTAPKARTGQGVDDVVVAQNGGNNGRGVDDRPLKERSDTVALEVPKVAAQSPVELKVSSKNGPGASVNNREEADAVKGNSSRLRLSAAPESTSEASSDGKIGSVGNLNLMPSSAVLDQIVGGAANDHLEEDEGNGTFLNTKEWKFASFFNRVKQSVGQHWDPNAQLRLRDPTAQIYGGRDRYTVLTVILTSSGELKEAMVSKTSGLDFLDLEAVKAFERAQPFPNPPTGLLANDQTVRFQFGFMLEMSGRPGIRLFRY
jgi:TonB family protein